MLSPAGGFLAARPSSLRWFVRFQLEPVVLLLDEPTASLDSACEPGGRAGHRELAKAE